MLNTRGVSATLPVRTSAPTAEGDGLALATTFVSVPPQSQPQRYIAEVTVTGGGTATLTLYGRNIAGGSGVWGIPVDSSGNLGLLGTGAKLAAGVYFFKIQDVGAFSEVCLLQTNVTSTPTITAKLVHLMDRTESR